MSSSTTTTRFSVGLRRALGAATVLTALFASAACGEPYRAFLDGLYARGYGEVALDYLESIRERPDLPANVRDTFQLETARSWAYASVETNDPSEAARRAAAARAEFDRFIERHPGHSELAAAYRDYGRLWLWRGRMLRTQSLAAAPDEAERYSTEARDAFQAAHTLFEKAVASCQKQLEAAAVSDSMTTQPPTPPPRVGPTLNQPAPAADRQPTAVERLRYFWIDVRFEAASLGLEIAQTYRDRRDPRRVEALSAATAQFADIAAEFPDTLIALIAQVRRGKLLEELDVLPEALAAYDAVLKAYDENKPSSRSGRNEPASSSDLENIVGEALRRRLAVAAQLGRRDEAIADARKRLRAHTGSRATPAFLGLALQYAELQLTALSEATVKPQFSAVGEVLGYLNAAALTPGPHQADALRLRRRYFDFTNEFDATSFQDGLAMAEAASALGDWDLTCALYERAVVLSHSVADVNVSASVRRQLALAQLRIGKPADAWTTAESALRKYPAGGAAPDLAALALHTASSLLAADPKSRSAQDRVEATAALVINGRPNQPEADDARLALARLMLLKGRPEDVATQLNTIVPGSSRFPEAALLSAQLTWRRYAAEAVRTTAQPQPESLVELRRAALHKLTECLAAADKLASPSSFSAEHRREATLLLAEVYLADAQPAEAVRVVQSAAEMIDDGSDPTVAVRPNLILLRAQLALADNAAAHGPASAVAAAGPDRRLDNQLLIEFVRRAAQGPDMGATMPIVERLVQRREVTFAERILLGDAARAAGQRAVAIAAYQAALNGTATTTPTPADQAKVTAAARLRLAGVLRDEHRYAEALAEVDLATRVFPQSLEVKTERGRILQALSRSNETYLDGAVAQWTQIRVALQAVSTTTPAYVDAVYNTAECLWRRSRRGAEPAYAAQAAQLLKGALLLNEKLSGPGDVQRFEALLKQIDDQRRRSGTQP